MSDQNTSLPIRTESAGDAIVKICDATTPAQQLKVNSDGSVDTTVKNGLTNPAGVEVIVGGAAVDPRAIRALTSSDVVTANQGTKGALANAWPVLPTDGTNSQGYTALGEAKVSVTQPLPAGTNNIGDVDANLRDGAGNLITSQANGGARALDVGIDVGGVQVDPRAIRALTSSDVVTANIKDSSGASITGANPLPVTVVSSSASGADVNDYKTSVALGAGASVNQDYTVTALKTLQLALIEASASGKIKVEFQIETAAGSGVFTTKGVQFNSTATPNIVFNRELSVAAGVKVRRIITNLDKQAMDVYSTLCGNEV